MPKPRQRVCLEAGFKLDLNELTREKAASCHAGRRHSPCVGQTTIRARRLRAHFTAHMSRHEGWLRIHIDDAEQTRFITSRPRNFGGHQWYFVCPVMNRCCSVLWMPPGATHFRCRQGWGRAVAYASQFLDSDNRAHRGKAKIKARLIADLNPEEWELPPKPKWMRWSTYNRLEEKFDRYEDVGARGIGPLLAKLLEKCP
jgi:hypothetical protein